MNIKLKPNEWVKKNIPISVFHHRLLQTDPTYKFIIYATIHAKANLNFRRDSNDNDYYDILNMSVPQDVLATPNHWLNHINNEYGTNLELGDVAQSSIFPELVFTNEESASVFDSIYEVIAPSTTSASASRESLSYGINTVLDFSIKISGGFIRNKILIDTKNIKKWLLDEISFSLLKTIMVKNDDENFKIKPIYIEIYKLEKQDIEFLESIFNKTNSLYPLNENGENIFWSYLDRYMSLTTLSQKENLFGFTFQGSLVSQISTKNLSLTLNQYNRPLSITTQNKFDSTNQRVYVTKATGGLPISTKVVKRSILQREVESMPTTKDLNLKLNDHIYMVNKR
jgi:hypothetical protein